jgi:hypothetical protein
LGDNTFETINFLGRESIDMYVIMSREHKDLDDHKLNTVGKVIIG